MELLDRVLQQKYKMEENGKKPTTLIISEEDFNALAKEIGLLQKDQVSLDLEFVGLKVEFSNNKNPVVR